MKANLEKSTKNNINNKKELLIQNRLFKFSLDEAELKKFEDQIS